MLFPFGDRVVAIDARGLGNVLAQLFVRLVLVEVGEHERRPIGMRVGDNRPLDFVRHRLVVVRRKPYHVGAARRGDFCRVRVLQVVGVFADYVNHAAVDVGKIIALVVYEFRLARERFRRLIFVVQPVERAVAVVHANALCAALVAQLDYLAGKFRGVNRRNDEHLFALLHIDARVHDRLCQILDCLFIHNRSFKMLYLIRVNACADFVVRVKREKCRPWRRLYESVRRVYTMPTTAGKSLTVRRYTASQPRSGNATSSHAVTQA